MTAHASTAPLASRPTPETRRTRFARDAAYLLLGWPLHLIAFVLVFTLFSVGLATIIIWVGLPILVAAAYAARGFATVERRATGRLLDRDEPRSAYREITTTSPVGRLLAPLRDPQSWLDVLWVVTGFFVSTITWSLALVWVVGAIGTVAGPVATLILEILLGNEHNGLAELLHLPGGTFTDMVMQFCLGLAFAFTCVPVLRGLAALQTGFSEMLLSNGARDRAQVADLTRSRDAVRRAETDALRRLERDIHDGPQQRLVRLTMDLARARRQADPAQADALIVDAMAQTQATLAELRQLSRGIAPPVLVDRGLEAAILEAAGRSVVPVTVYASLDDLPSHVETAAYFVVSEALANLNKHARATTAEVYAAVQDDHLYLTISDDGVGGASPAKGHGLAGLAERLRGVDGTLTVTSPDGGPTSIEAVVPCAS
ncbi:sensor histidine kinase [Mariniluteicoccus flavus]